MARTIADALDFELDPIYVPQRPNEVKYATCSSEKARKLLGYSTKVTLVEGIRRMVEERKIKGPVEFDYHYDIEIINDKTPKTWVEHLI